jgi:hypothetical protein
MLKNHCDRALPQGPDHCSTLSVHSWSEFHKRAFCSKAGMMRKTDCNGLFQVTLEKREAFGKLNLMERRGHISTFHTTLLTASKGATNPATAGTAVKRLDQRPAKETAMRRTIEQLLEESLICPMWNVET